LAFDYTSTDATCNNNDGSLTVSEISGGATPYKISYEGGTFSDVDLNNLPVYNNITGGNKSIQIKDSNGCIFDEQAKVNFPGYVNADIAINPATCSGKGLNGSVVINIDPSKNTNQPPYQYGFAPDSISPAEVSMTDIFPNTPVTIDSVTNGNFYALFTSGNGCASNVPITVSGGPTPVDFSVEEIHPVACKGSSGSIYINQITGDPDSPMNIEILAVPSFNSLYNQDFDLGNIRNGLSIDSSLTDVLTAGAFQLQLSQNQNGCLLKKTSQNINITQPDGLLDFQVTDSKVSFPDFPSGSITISISPSGGSPYQASIVTVAPLFPGEEISRDYQDINEENGPLKITYTYEDIYSGEYKLSVKDDYGCEVSKDFTLNYDSAIFIPNVFTPNNDLHNDKFYIRNLPPKGSGTELVVTNRWGKTVFRSKDYNENDLWDGGQEPDGTYYYVLKVPGKGTYNGWVEIWRGFSR